MWGVRSVCAINVYPIIPKQLSRNIHDFQIKIITFSNICSVLTDLYPPWDSFHWHELWCRFLTVLCFQVTYFQRVASCGICWYLIVKFTPTFWVNSVTYRRIYPHASANVVPHDVPYPIEPYWYVLGRVTSVFSTSAPKPDITIIWWQVHRKRYLQ